MGVIGAMSGKFVVKSGLLLMAARIDMHTTTAVLDPSEAVSIFDARDAARIGAATTSVVPQSIERSRTVGVDHVEIKLHTVRIGAVPIRDGFVLGADLLKRTPLLLDFHRNRLRVTEHRQLRKAEAAMSPLAAHVGADGCLTMAAKSVDGRPLKIALVGRSLPAAAASLTVRLGNITLEGQAIAQSGPCRDSDATIGWEAFAQHRLLFDLEHDRVWID